MMFNGNYPRGGAFSRFAGCFGNGYFSPWHMVIIGIVVLLLVAGAIWLIFRRRGSSNEMQILREKLARGEITTEEYEHRRDVLNQK